MKFIIIALVAALILIDAAILNCDYDSIRNNELGNVYECKAELLQINENDTTIKSITKICDRYKSKSDVTQLKIVNQNIAKFPLEIENFFKNLKALIITNTSISEVKNDNLKNFTNLAYLDLSNNKISDISSDLFFNNQKLKYIYLKSNFINSISIGTFDGLASLKTIDLRNNTDVNYYASNENEVLLVKEKVFTTYMLMLFEYLNQRLNKLEKKDDLENKIKVDIMKNNLKF